MKFSNGIGAVALALLALPGLAAAQQDEFKIGLIAPTTGPAATVGQRQLSTFQWWEKDINDSGGIKGRKVRVIACNDEGSPERSVTCARDLLAQHVVLLFNSSVTGPILAVMPLVEKGPVMLTPSPNIVPSPNTFVFQTSPSDQNMTQSIASFLKRNNVAKLGMVAATDASGEVGLASAQAIFPKNGIALTTARIDLKATDASTQLARLASNDVPAIYSSYSGGAASAVVKSFNNLGLSQPLIISYANISDSFVALIKNDLPDRLMGTGLKAVDPKLLSDPKERERTETFAKKYLSYKGERIDQMNLVALGVADTAAAVLRNVADPSDPVAVRDFLQKTPINSFQTIRFSAQSHVGMNENDVAVLELRNGAWVAAGPIGKK
jgi:branched-chain amino acid transport system substrate-binding protein